MWQRWCPRVLPQPTGCRQCECMTCCNKSTIYSYWVQELLFFKEENTDLFIPWKAEAFKPSDTQMGFQCQALQNVVTQSCLNNSGLHLKWKYHFREVAVASSGIKWEKMEKPKGNFSLWCDVLLQVWHLYGWSFCFPSSTEELASTVHTRRRSFDHLLPAVVPNLVTKSLVCLLSLCDFEMLSGLVEISPVKITVSALLIWDFCM